MVSRDVLWAYSKQVQQWHCCRKLPRLVHQQRKLWNWSTKTNVSVNKRAIYSVFPSKRRQILVSCYCSWSDRAMPGSRPDERLRYWLAWFSKCLRHPSLTKAIDDVYVGTVRFETRFSLKWLTSAEFWSYRSIDLPVSGSCLCVNTSAYRFIQEKTDGSRSVRQVTASWHCIDAWCSFSKMYFFSLQKIRDDRRTPSSHFESLSHAQSIPLDSNRIDASIALQDCRIYRQQQLVGRRISLHFANRLSHCSENTMKLMRWSTTAFKDLSWLHY